jgi:hydrogenase-4 component B
MFILMTGCILTGLFPATLAPILDTVSASWANSTDSLPVVLLPLTSLVPFRHLGIASAALFALLCAFLITTRQVIKKSAAAGTWDCGYSSPTGRMQYSASSIADSFTAVFSALLRMRMHSPRIKKVFPDPSELRSGLDDPVLDRILLPFAKKANESFTWFRRFQQGVIQNYILYIFITVVILLAALIPFREIFAALAAL